MALDIYFRQDIRNVLVAVAVQSIAVHVADGCHSPGYLRGSLDSIRAVALGHGCVWPDVFADIRASVAPGYHAILDAATAELPTGTAVLEDGT